jgi:DNA-binding MarR family transcriptional regulator
MATKSNTAEALVPNRPEGLKPLYLEAVSRVERLHRRLLDLIKDEFDRMGWDDINPVQALLMFNIGDSELTAGELRSRGYYLGSNVSYNLKKLVETGYIFQERSRTDRRSVRIRLTPKGEEVRQPEQGSGPSRTLLGRSDPLQALIVFGAGLRPIEQHAGVGLCCLHATLFAETPAIGRRFLICAANPGHPITWFLNHSSTMGELAAWFTRR